jgi:hypothetical protein
MLTIDSKATCGKQFHGLAENGIFVDFLFRCFDTWE